ACSILVFVPAFYLFLPMLFPLVKRGPSSGSHKTPAKFFGDLALSSFRMRKGLVVIGVLILAGGFFAFHHLGSNTNALRYFPESDSLKQDFASIEADGTGLTTVEILARHANGDTWRSQDAALKTVGDGLVDFPGTRGSFGPTDVLRDLSSAHSDANFLSGLALRQAERFGEQGEWARWTLRLPSGGSETVLTTVDALRTHMDALEDSLGLETIVTGTMPLMLHMQDDLIGTLVRSLGLTLLATFLFFLLVTRSWRQRIGVVIVNLVPVACSLIAAFLLGFELDAASVMVAAVVLSLAVDNTFHLLHAFHGTKADLDGMRASFRRVGPPAAISACALAIGFASLAFSGFTPTARFGLLTAIGAAASLPADLILLPAFLLPSSRADS
ncbi:MAG: MMPL family transporter, partial [Planctomycetota bacterium]